MTNAHVNSFLLLSEPFASSLGSIYDFGKSSTISNKVREEIPLMLRERLTPPPDETYSLHRKLSGCFLLCAKLKARVTCSLIFNNVNKKYLD